MLLVFISFFYFFVAVFAEDLYTPAVSYKGKLLNRLNQ